MKLPLLLVSLGLIKLCWGHAIFWEPPSRASLGRHSMNMCNVPVNYNHMSLWCGGILTQHNDVNKGRCGICGDEYSATVKPHEVPGEFATGIIARSYFNPGQLITVVIDVVANHRGFFLFNICPNNNPDLDPQPECFEANPLTFEDGSTRFVLPTGEFKHRVELKVRLPADLECWQCILQWTYVTGNRWGVGPQTPIYYTEDCMNDVEGKLGCGNQETFRGCADICIGPKCPQEPCQLAQPFSAEIPATSTPPPASQPPSDPPPQFMQECISTGAKPPFQSVLGDAYCESICTGKPMYVCNLYICYCDTIYRKDKRF